MPQFPSRFFLRFSKKLLSKTEDNSIKSLVNVFGEQARFVWLLKDGIEIETSVDTLCRGDIIVVHAGETIPVDGKITFDTAQIVLMNQSLTQLIDAFDVAQDYKKNMKFNITTSTLPGVITLFGALFFGFGIVHSVILNGISLTVGASNAIWPFLRAQKEKQLSEVLCGFEFLTGVVRNRVGSRE